MRENANRGNGSRPSLMHATGVVPDVGGPASACMAPAMNFRACTACGI